MGGCDAVLYLLAADAIAVGHVLVFRSTDSRALHRQAVKMSPLVDLLHDVGGIEVVEQIMPCGMCTHGEQNNILRVISLRLSAMSARPAMVLAFLEVGYLSESTWSWGGYVGHIEHAVSPWLISITYPDYIIRENSLSMIDLLAITVLLNE